MLHRLFPPEEGQASSCAQILQLHPAIRVISSHRGLYLAEIFLWKSLFVLSPTQTSSVSKGSSIENSLNSGMWNHFCSFDQAHKLVVLISHLCISITHLRKPVKQKYAIRKPQR